MTHLLEPEVLQLIEEKREPSVIVERFERSRETENIHKTALVTASVRSDHDSLTQYLLGLNYELNASVGYDNPSPLHIASLKGRNDMIELLILHGADVKNEAYITVGGKREIMSPLQCAILKDNCDTMNILQKYKATGDRLGNSAMHLAARLGAKKCLDYLFSLDGFCKQLEHRNTFGETPLLQGMSCSIEMVKYLISKGANVNVKNTGGQHILHYAIMISMRRDHTWQSWMKLLELVTFIMELVPFDLVNAHDTAGFTPLIMLLHNYKQLLFSSCKTITSSGYDESVIGITEKSVKTILMNFYQTVKLFLTLGPVVQIKTADIAGCTLAEISDITGSPFPSDILTQKCSNIIITILKSLIDLLILTLVEADPLSDETKTMLKQKLLKSVINTLKLAEKTSNIENIGDVLTEFLRTYPCKIIACCLCFGVLPEVSLDLIFEDLSLSCVCFIVTCLEQDKRNEVIQKVEDTRSLTLPRMVSLKDLCRIQIYSCLQGKLIQMVPKLPLPGELKKYLQFYSLLH